MGLVLRICGGCAGGVVYASKLAAILAEMI
jgi:hypothetical protein